MPKRKSFSWGEEVGGGRGVVAAHNQLVGQIDKDERSRYDEQQVEPACDPGLPIACSYLFFKSGYIPRGLAAFGVIVSGWAAVCTIAFIISPDFAKLVNLWWFDTGFWLVIKGLRPERTTTDRAPAGVT
jgi:hypothetical protein